MAVPGGVSRLRRLTTAWTDAHLWLIIVAAGLVTLGNVATAGTHETPQVGMVTIAASIAAFALATFTDAFGGLIVGLAAAALYTAMHQYVPDAHPVGFFTQALTIVLMLLVGLASGLVADRIRRGRRMAARVGSQAVAPVEGSLGLISASDAAVILDDERVRAALHERPLCQAVVEVQITDQRLREEDQRRARRTVARALEAELRVTDVVYVTDEGHFGVILPETTAAAAQDMIEPALMLARAATFADRTAGQRRMLGDVAEVEVLVTALVSPAGQPIRNVTAGRPAPRAGAQTRRRRRPASERTQRP